MADISITCPKCNSVTIASEFVDDANLKCTSCGAMLEKPGALEQAAKNGAASVGITKPAVKHSLRLAKDRKVYDKPEDAGDAAEVKSLKDIIAQTESSGGKGKLELRPEVKVKTSKINHAVVAGFLFLVLGGGMGYLRYGGVLPDNIMEMSVQYSWIVFLVFHFMIVLKAMTDNMMQGILSLLVPGYSLYYLFSISDDFYLRAILAGVLVGIGEDAALMLKEHAGTLTGIVNGFIAGGGGDIR